MTRLSDRELAVFNSAKGSFNHLELQALLNEARRLQNEKIAELLVRCGRTLASALGLAALRRRLQRQAIYRRTLRELSSLDAAQLRDIGLTPGEIEVKALASSQAALPDLPGWWTRAGELARRWRSERKTAQQLRRLDDRMLRDIGLERSEIDSVAAAIAAGRSPFGRTPAAAAAVFGLKRPALAHTETRPEAANSERSSAAAA